MISFEILIKGKKIIFSSVMNGLIVNGKEYLAIDDGVLIYDKTKDAHADEVICQLSSNTSTLIPAFRILGLPYNAYFDDRDVVESQNDITFYKSKSKLAEFYNKYSTDGVELERREPIIREAVNFLIKTAKEEGFLSEEFLKEYMQECEELGEYEGIKIFNAHKGLPQLKSRFGIHVGVESVMVSTPLDKYAEDVVALGKELEGKSNTRASYKKNRVRFEKSDRLLSELGLK